MRCRIVFQAICLIRIYDLTITDYAKETRTNWTVLWNSKMITLDILISQLFAWHRIRIKCSSLFITTSFQDSFQYKDGPSRYGNVHFKDKTVVIPSYYYYENPHMVRRHLYIEKAPCPDVKSISGSGLNRHDLIFSTYCKLFLSIDTPVRVKLIAMLLLYRQHHTSYINPIWMSCTPCLQTCHSGKDIRSFC